MSACKRCAGSLAVLLFTVIDNVDSVYVRSLSTHARQRSSCALAMFRRRLH